jgi:hypothetical protein
MGVLAETKRRSRRACIRIVSAITVCIILCLIVCVIVHMVAISIVRHTLYSPPDCSDKNYLTVFDKTGDWEYYGKNPCFDNDYEDDYPDLRLFPGY